MININVRGRSTSRPPQRNLYLSSKENKGIQVDKFEEEAIGFDLEPSPDGLQETKNLATLRLELYQANTLKDLSFSPLEILQSSYTDAITGQTTITATDFKLDAYMREINPVDLEGRTLLLVATKEDDDNNAFIIK